MKEFNLPIFMSIITVYIGPTNHAMMTSNASYNALAVGCTNGKYLKR